VLVAVRKHHRSKRVEREGAFWARKSHGDRTCRRLHLRFGFFSLGISARHIHGEAMSDNAQSGESASLLAEEILRKIYGDDLKGCPVSLDSIAAIIGRGINQRAPTNELLALYEKVMEAMQLLSAPPPAEKIADPKELQLLLSERLDSIHALITKTMTTAGLFKMQNGKE